MTPTMQQEITRRLAAGCRQLTLDRLDYILRTLGYTLDRRLDCRGTARYLDTGDTYPATTTGIKHIRSGLSFAHVDAPKDDNFKKLQQFRYSAPFVVLNDSLLEI